MKLFSDRHYTFSVEAELVKYESENTKKVVSKTNQVDQQNHPFAVCENKGISDMDTPCEDIEVTSRWTIEPLRTDEQSPPPF